MEEWYLASVNNWGVNDNLKHSSPWALFNSCTCLCCVTGLPIQLWYIIQYITWLLVHSGSMSRPVYPDTVLLPLNTKELEKRHLFTAIKSHHTDKLNSLSFHCPSIHHTGNIELPAYCG